MKNKYFSFNTLRQFGLTALLAGGAALTAQAQLAYTPSLASNVAGTYTDLGTDGTAIATANTDDANSAATNIGFTFNFGGQAFTQFVLNTNGYIKLGATAPSTPYFYGDPQTTDSGPMQSSVDNYLILPFNTDLTAGTGPTEYRASTTGSLGSRVCTIQWKNVSDKASTITTQYRNFSFQVKLYEGSNRIEFVYGTATAGTGTATYRTVGVGLKGNGITDLVTVQKASSTPWASAIIQTGDYPVQTSPTAPTGHNVRQTVLPDAGRTYRFVAAVANDGSVTAIQTLGKLPTTALPHTFQVPVANLGTTDLTNVAVTLTVTGANTYTATQTIASILVNTTGTASFTLPNTFVPGNNTLTASIPADGNSSNNSASIQQNLNAYGIFSYVPADQAYTPAAATGLGASTPANGLIFADSFTPTTGGTVTTVSAFIQDANSVGKVVYGVVLSATGSILGRSPNYTIVASDINNYRQFVISTPPTVAANTPFLAGMAQNSGSTTSIYPMGYQNDPSGRTGSYFVTALAGGTPTDVGAQGYRFMIEARVTNALGTSTALQRALSVYPNPSASGVFTLDVQGANATAGLGVEVTNQLGQRVFTGSARDNFSTTLDLSRLAPGIYFLTVRNGSDYSSTKLSIGL